MASLLCGTTTSPFYFRLRRCWVVMLQCLHGDVIEKYRSAAEQCYHSCLLIAAAPCSRMLDPRGGTCIVLVGLSVSEPILCGMLMTHGAFGACFPACCTPYLDYQPLDGKSLRDRMATDRCNGFCQYYRIMTGRVSRMIKVCSQMQAQLIVHQLSGFQDVNSFGLTKYD